MGLTKAVIVNLDAPRDTPSLPMLFNPPQYSLSKTNQFAEIKIPGLATSVLQFVNGDAKTLTLELFFDTTDSGRDVRGFTEPVVRLMEPDIVTRAPPRLLLLWGSLAFACYLITAREEFDYFTSRGVPLRARITAEFKGHDTLQRPLTASQAPGSEVTSRHVAKLGDTLQDIAATAYRDPAQWRRVGLANGIDDPRSVPVGMSLQVPRT